MKLTEKDYNQNNLSDLLVEKSHYDINLEAFNKLQRTITGWPAGKPNADDTHRPERKIPTKKRVIIFSPHPDDDVVSMGGTFDRLVSQAKGMEGSGASLLLLEAVPKEVSKIVRDELKIPVYGIGAGPEVDGQLVISHDILGLFWDFKPKFIKQYINGEQMFHNAINEYANEVHTEKFPDDQHSYKMKEEELEKLLGMSGSSWKYD